MCGLFLGCTVQFGSYVRFPACGRRDLRGLLAGRRLFFGRWASPPPAARCSSAVMPGGRFLFLKQACVLDAPLPPKTSSRHSDAGGQGKSSQGLLLEVPVAAETGTITERASSLTPWGWPGQAMSSLSMPELPQTLRGPGRVALRHWTAPCRVKPVVVTETLVFKESRHRDFSLRCLSPQRQALSQKGPRRLCRGSGRVKR